MALKVGELFATMTLKDEDFTRSLNAVLAQLERVQTGARELVQPPEPEPRQLTAQLEVCVNAARQAGMRMNQAAAQTLAATPALRTAAAQLGPQLQPVLRSSLLAAGASSGGALGDGLVRGINSRRGAVAAAAARLARAAVAAVRSAIREGSPSKVMHRSGAYFAQGFANGIADSTHLVRSSALSLADAAVDAAGTTLPAGRSAVPAAAPQPIDYDKLAASMARLQMNLQLDGRNLARLNAREAALAQQRCEHSAALGYYGILKGN